MEGEEQTEASKQGSAETGYDSRNDFFSHNQYKLAATHLEFSELERESVADKVVLNSNFLATAFLVDRTTQVAFFVCPTGRTYPAAEVRLAAETYLAYLGEQMGRVESCEQIGRVDSYDPTEAAVSPGSKSAMKKRSIDQSNEGEAEVEDTVVKHVRFDVGKAEDAASDDQDQVTTSVLPSDPTTAQDPKLLADEDLRRAFVAAKSTYNDAKTRHEVAEAASHSAFMACVVTKIELKRFLDTYESLSSEHTRREMMQKVAQLTPDDSLTELPEYLSEPRRRERVERAMMKYGWEDTKAREFVMDQDTEVMEVLVELRRVSGSL
ncbi:hypothetical protein LTR37_017079 [Vermiconidia calcicola]|uniref:Uncharacterized protein n=1 Tax=Vermiconidia calcicola TaxID=1690605 RepID=A0ACC3ML38_9PEZI|nr:hypothetical protein LTR37_017079 [Vermiconidia calcicola]